METVRQYIDRRNAERQQEAIRKAKEERRFKLGVSIAMWGIIIIMIVLTMLNLPNALDTLWEEQYEKPVEAYTE